jgi:micrococcal nuclease
VVGTPLVTVPAGGAPGNVSETGRVTDVIDGDTIDVDVNGSVYRIRYVGVNTPERGEPCYSEARTANVGLVLNQTVSLVRDVSNTDRFDRLLRYVYVGDRNVNAELVANGWAEAVSYPPDTAQFDQFVALEQAATVAGRGCHPTGIFNDGTYER